MSKKATTYRDHPEDGTAGPWTEREEGTWDRCTGWGVEVATVRERTGTLRFVVETRSDHTINAKTREQRARSLDEAKHLADTALRLSGFTLRDEP